MAAAGSTETAKLMWSLLQRILCVTKKMQNLAQLPFLQGDEEKPSGSTALVGTVSLLFAVLGGEGHCSLGNVWGPGPWGTSLRGYRHLHPILEEGLR